jgi:hypothetical protein
MFQFESFGVGLVESGFALFRSWLALIVPSSSAASRSVHWGRLPLNLSQLRAKPRRTEVAASSCRQMPDAHVPIMVCTQPSPPPEAAGLWTLQKG